jgi:hypothetical protein
LNRTLRESPVLLHFLLAEAMEIAENGVDETLANAIEILAMVGNQTTVGTYAGDPSTKAGWCKSPWVYSLLRLSRQEGWDEVIACLG